MATINTNMAANVAANSLTRNERSMGATMERLSTGLRINSAKDDAAGLAITSKMTSQINGLNQAVRNANDAISMIQVAEGAMKEVTNMFQRMRELAVQAISDSNTSADRTALNNEYKQLSAEVQRIAENTQWNGTNILDGGRTSTTFQIGANASQTIAVNFGDLGTNNATGALSNNGTATVTLTLSEALNSGDVISYKVTDDTTGVSNYATISATPLTADVATATEVETTSAGATLTGNLLPEANNTRNIGNGSTNFNSIWASTRFRGNDNVKLVLGNGQDFILYHDGTDNLIEAPQGGDLKIMAGTGDNANETCAKFIHDGAVELYHNNSKKFETTSGGVLATGDVDSTTGTFERTNTFTSQLIFHDSNETKLVHGSNGQVKLSFVGTGNAARGSIDASSGFIRIKNGADEQAVMCRDNGAVELYHDNVKKLQTDSNGVVLFGNLYQADNEKLILGTGSDLQIYHDGQKSIINDVGTGHLEINTNNLRVQNAAANETLIYASQDGSVDLYHNNSRRVETTSEGVTVNGPSGYSKIRFDTNGSHRGSIYFNNSNVGGFLDESGNWAANFDRGSNSFLYSNWMPSSDSYDLGSSSYRWGEVHAVNFYGNGSNLTGVDPTIADGCIYENNQTISSTVSTSSSKNSFAAGDINITGTLTVANNTNFVII